MKNRLSDGIVVGFGAGDISDATKRRILMDLSTFKPQDENEILKEIKRKELSEDEISSLINLGKKIS